MNNTEEKLDLAKQHLTPKQQQEVREKVKNDLVTDAKPIYISLHTSDGGNIVHVPVPADINGKITAELNAGVRFPVDIAKIALGSKVAADVGGQAGFKLTYKVYSITGISLKQQ